MRGAERDRAEQALGKGPEVVAVRRLDDVGVVGPRADDDAELADPSVRQGFSRQHRVVERAECAPGHDDHATVGEGSGEVGQRLTGVGELDEQASRAFDDDEVVACAK